MIDSSSSLVKLIAISHRPSLTQINSDNRFAVLNVLSPIDLEQNELTMLSTEPKKNYSKYNYNV